MNSTFSPPDGKFHEGGTVFLSSSMASTVPMSEEDHLI